MLKLIKEDPYKKKNPVWSRFSVEIITCSIGDVVVLGGLGVTCSPRDPRFAGPNPAEVEGFSKDVKILSTSPPGGTLCCESRV